MSDFNDVFLGRLKINSLGFWYSACSFVWLLSLLWVLLLIFFLLVDVLPPLLGPGVGWLVLADWFWLATLVLCTGDALLVPSAPWLFSCLPFVVFFVSVFFFLRTAPLIFLRTFDGLELPEFLYPQICSSCGVGLNCTPRSRLFGLICQQFPMNFEFVTNAKATIFECLYLSRVWCVHRFISFQSLVFLPEGMVTYCATLMVCLATRLIRYLNFIPVFFF